MPETRDIEQTIDAYCSAWSEPDELSRWKILGAVWAPGATYSDPNAMVAGVDALVAHLGKVIAGRPGAKVLRTSSVDEHHGIARFAFSVVQNGAVIRAGIDIAELAVDGKIQRITGFFGPLAGK